MVKNGDQEDNGKLDRKKTMTMNWEGLGEFDDDDGFFDSRDRLSSAISLDLASSSSDEDGDGDFDDCRISFSSAVSSLSGKSFRAQVPMEMPQDYDVWMAAPGSISDRRRRLLQGMGLGSTKNLLGDGSVSTPRVVSIEPKVVVEINRKEDSTKRENRDKQDDQEQPIHHQSPPTAVILVRSRSEAEIEVFTADKQRKEEMLGKISKPRLTRTSSIISMPCTKFCPYQTPSRTTPEDGVRGQSTSNHGGTSSTSVFSNPGFNAFFLIKNLDTGKEFIVKENTEDGMWNRLSDMQTGNQLTMEEFEKCIGHSPVVKELMRRENANASDLLMDFRKFNSYLSKSLRMSKRSGAALLRNIKGVAHSVSLKVTDKEKDAIGSNGTSSLKASDKKHGRNNNKEQNQWVKVRQTGRTYKEMSALHLCQEINAHQGAIWTMKFNLDAHFLASAGEDRVIHVWEVQECDIMSNNEGSLTPVHPSLSGSPERAPTIGDVTMPLDKKKRGKGSHGKKRNQIPDYVHVPETMFSLSDKPICSFSGHQNDVLDLSWSRSQQLLSSSMDKTVRLWDLESNTCLKVFTHNDYVTCIQFNPVDEDYFISGSLDAKVRIWNIPDRHVVDWTDLNEMVTACCYTPDGQGALIGSHKGNCRFYNIKDSRLTQTNQIDMHTKKKAQGKKITGFKFSPANPSELLLTSADSRIRIVDGSDVVQKFRGFRNTSSQISASYTLDAKYIVCASEDSNVYIWKRQEPRTNAGGRITTSGAHEHFPCKDVSVAIPWHGVVKGEPPPVQIHSKRHVKRAATITTVTGEAAATSTATSNKKPNLPPLPKKTNNTHNGNCDGDDTLVEKRGLLEEDLSDIRKNETCGGGDSDSAVVSTSSSRVLSWSWFDGSSSRGAHAAQQLQPTAWGMVIVTATLGGEIRTYQNFGLPRRISRQTNPFL